MCKANRPPSECPNNVCFPLSIAKLFSICGLTSSSIKVKKLCAPPVLGHGLSSGFKGASFEITLGVKS